MEIRRDRRRQLRTLDDPPQYPEKQSPSPGWGTDSRSPARNAPFRCVGGKGWQASLTLAQHHGTGRGLQKIRPMWPPGHTPPWRVRAREPQRRTKTKKRNGEDVKSCLCTQGTRGHMWPEKGNQPEAAARVMKVRGSRSTIRSGGLPMFHWQALRHPEESIWRAVKRVAGPTVVL